jgi:DNA polymerase III delta prime subunit
MQVPPELVDKLLNACKKAAFAAVEAEVREAIAEGYNIKMVLEQLVTRIIEYTELSDTKKARAASAMATADRRLVDGADGTLQLLHVMSVLQQVFH